MVLINGYREYCADGLVQMRHADGKLRCQAYAVRSDTPPEIVEKMKRLNEMWKEDHHGHPLYLFPGDENYPAELLKETGGK